MQEKTKQNYRPILTIAWTDFDRIKLHYNPFNFLTVSCIIIVIGSGIYLRAFCDTNLWKLFEVMKYFG